MDPLVLHSINKFMLMLIPKFLLTEVPAFLSAFLVTALPYTPINIIVFTLIFAFIFMTDLFGMASSSEHYCRYNKPKITNKPSLWQAIKNSYLLYFLIAYSINLFTVMEFRTFNINTLASIS